MTVHFCAVELGSRVARGAAGFASVGAYATTVFTLLAAFFALFYPLAWLTFWLLKRTLGLRADTLHEQRGLDYTEHYEVGYPEFQKELLHGGKG